MTTVTLKNEGRIQNPVVTGKEFGRLFCDAIGIPLSGVKSITMRIEVNEPVTVEIRRFLKKPECDGLTEKLSQFVLCKPEDIQEGDDE